MRFLSVLLLLSRLLSAQGIAASATPEVIPPGMSTTLTVINSTPSTIYLPTLCVFTTVRSGTPLGPVVDSFSCGAALTALGPCLMAYQTWTPPSSLPGGLYYIEVQYFVTIITGPLNTEYVPVLLQPAPNPILASQTLARIGFPLVMSINAPTAPGGLYFAAASSTTNSGFTIPGGPFVSLDLDPLFSLSFPTPLPGIFTNFQGALDFAGQATNIIINIPLIPALFCQPLHVQAAVFDSASVTTMTNPLTFIIAL